MIIVTEEIWADKDGNPVPFGDARGVTVLHGAGVEISDEQAEKAGLLKKKPEPPPAAEPEPETKAVDEPPATKDVKGPEKTK